MGGVHAAATSQFGRRIGGIYSQRGYGGMMRIRVNENEWRVDKRIPLAVIIAMFLQIAGILIWATQLDARVESIEHRTLADASLSEKFARLEERMENLKRDTDYIKHQMDMVTERMIKNSGK
jgi:Tfp pilus assembly protein PilO